MPPTSLKVTLGRSTSAEPTPVPPSQLAPDLAVHHFPVVVVVRAYVGASAGFPGGRRAARQVPRPRPRVFLDRPLVLPHGAVDVPGAEQQPGVEDVGLRGWVRPLNQIFDHDQRPPSSCPAGSRPRRARASPARRPALRQGGAELLFGLLVAAVADECRPREGGGAGCRARAAAPRARAWSSSSPWGIGSPRCGAFGGVVNQKHRHVYDKAGGGRSRRGWVAPAHASGRISGGARTAFSCLDGLYRLAIGCPLRTRPPGVPSRHGPSQRRVEGRIGSTL